jgi:tetratricopeptide (TPR) repeat protein
MKSLASIVFIGVFLCLHVLGYSSVQQLRKDMTFRFDSPNSHIPAELIRMLSGEFKGIMADYLLLEVGSFVGSGQRGTPEDWRNVHLALKQSMALDPYFQQTYIYAQGTLTWDAQLYDETNELLAISRKHRPWDWRPGYFMGFNYYYFLNDYAKAAEAFLETSKVENAPLLAAVLGARLAVKGNRTAAAIALLEDSLANNPDLDGDSRKEIENRLAALKGIVELEKALVQYQQKFNGQPDTLEKLVETQCLNKMPINPYGDSYLYDAQTGTVTFDKVK